MDPVRSSERLVNAYQTTQDRIPEVREESFLLHCYQFIVYNHFQAGLCDLYMK
jgi:hypothetical protein